MDFAPYQDSTPSQIRALSPQPQPQRPGRPGILSSSASPRVSFTGGSRSPVRNGKPLPGFPDLSKPLPQPQPRQYSALSDESDLDEEEFNERTGFSETNRGRRNLDLDIDLFQTGLGIRMDAEAAMAYLVPPLSGVVLLVLERRSEYVRFHAWQATLLFSAVVAVHIILIPFGQLSWILFVLDVGAMVLLFIKAWRDAALLDRFEVPLFGRLASRLVDRES